MLQDKCASRGFMVSWLVPSMEGQALVQQEAHLVDNNCHSLEQRQGPIFSPLLPPSSFLLLSLAKPHFSPWSLGSLSLLFPIRSAFPELGKRQAGHWSYFHLPS